MRASGSQCPRPAQTRLVKNQAYLPRRAESVSSAPSEKRRPLSLAGSSSRPPTSVAGPTSESPNTSPSRRHPPVSKLTSENGGSSSLVKSPLDINFLPAFYSEPPPVTRSVSIEERRSSLENLITVISNVLKSTNEAVSQCPVIQSSLRAIDPLKSYRNINHVKELNDKLAQLESDNFKLKLKLFYLEEERGKGGYSAESNQNIHLQVELQEAKSDLAKRNELLRETLLYLSNIDKDFDKRTQSPGTGKSSESGLRDKTTSEDESLATFAADSIATTNDTRQVRDRDWLKTAFNRLLSQALTIAPELNNLIENAKRTFNEALAKEATGDFENLVHLDMDIEIKNKRIEELESELKKYQELDSCIPTRDTPVSHEVEQELRSLHQAVVEKDRLYQDAIKEKYSILKDSEERCESVIAVARERDEESQRLKERLRETRMELESAKELLENSHHSVAKLRNEITDLKKAMESEAREKNRILSEAEVLDQMQNEQSQELAKLKTRLGELGQTTLAEALHKDRQLEEARQKLDETLAQLEILKNESKAIQIEIPAASIMWDASSIRNNSALETSRNLMDRSSIGEFLKSFQQGDDANNFLLNHVYELEKFLHKLLTSENPAELLSQGSFTPVYVDSLRNATVDADGTLDASQSGVSLMHLERTFRSLPDSMINAEPWPRDPQTETESDGTCRDRDTSVNGLTKRVDAEYPSNDSLFAGRIQAEKGEKRGRVEYVRDVVLIDVSSRSSSSNLSFKLSASSDVKNPDRVPRRRWSSSPFPHLPDPSGCFKNATDQRSGADYRPLSLFRDDGRETDSDTLDHGLHRSLSVVNVEVDRIALVPETTSLPSHCSSHRPLVLPLSKSRGKKLDSAGVATLRKADNNDDKRHVGGPSAAVSPPARHRRSNWMKVEESPKSVRHTPDNVSLAAVTPYYYHFSSESDIWSEPDRIVSMERMGLDTQAITIKFDGLEGEGRAYGMFFEAKKPIKRCCHPTGNSRKLASSANFCRNWLVGDANCSNVWRRRHRDGCACASVSSNSDSDSVEPDNSISGTCYLARSRLAAQHGCGGNFHEKGCCAAPRNKTARVGKGTERELLVSRLEKTVEALSGELAKFRNENPRLILRLLDTLKESDVNSMSSLLEGQILSSFEILGAKMDSLGSRMNDVNVAAGTLAECFKPRDSPDSKRYSADARKITPIASPQNDENISPSGRGSPSSPVDVPGGIEAPPYALHSGQSEAALDNLTALRDCYDQLVESLRSSLDWIKSVNDGELDQLIEKQGVENLLNKNVSGSDYGVELSKLNQWLPGWVRLNRSLFQTLVKSLREKKRALQVREEQVGALTGSLETKFKDLKRVQDWNLRLQNELDGQKLSLASTLEKLASVQEAFLAASEEVESKTDSNAKIWGENKILKSRLESSVSDSDAVKELCHQLREELDSKRTEKDDLEAELSRAYGQIRSYASEVDSRRESLENQLKSEYEKRIERLKDEIDHLTRSRRILQSEKDQMLAELKSTRDESAKLKETERVRSLSHETLQKQLEERTKELRASISSYETELLKRTSLESSLRETLKLKLSAENDRRLLGERLNDIRGQNRQTASRLKEEIQKRDSEKDILRQSLKDAEDKLSETRARLQLESLARTRIEEERVGHLGEEPADGRLRNEIVADDIEMVQFPWKQALQREKEKVERYKKNLAYAKVLLKRKGVGLKSASSLSGLSDEALDEADHVAKDSDKCSKSEFFTDASSQTSDVEKALRILSVPAESEESIDKQSLENVIQGLLEETRSLRADLDQTAKANKELSEKIKEYELHFDGAEVLPEPLLEGAVTEDLVNSAGARTRRTEIAQSQLDWTLANSGDHRSSTLRDLSRLSVEKDVLSSSESLLHSRVIEQLGGRVASGAVAGFTLISDEVPVRDIDNDAASHLRNVAPDFQSSNEEIETIISGVGGVNFRRSPRSIYSSPDLGIESDPNRDRGWSGSPASDVNRVTKRNFSILASLNTSAASTRLPENVGRESILVAVCPLADLALLKKEAEESVAILEGIKARLKDRIFALSRRPSNSSPAKSLEYSTLKEVDSSCYKLRVCLRRSVTLLSAFSAEPEKPAVTPDIVVPQTPLRSDNQDREELKSLRLLYEEQSEKLKEASEALDFYQKRKENVEKAISRQLSKTKRVLKKAKGNLWRERKVDEIPQDAANSDLSKPFASVTNSNTIKRVASTPALKFNK